MVFKVYVKLGHFLVQNTVASVHRDTQRIIHFKSFQLGQNKFFVLRITIAQSLHETYNSTIINNN